MSNIPLLPERLQDFVNLVIDDLLSLDLVNYEFDNTFDNNMFSL